jgi:cobalt-precorrin-5B (C1)-methyltransferase
MNNALNYETVEIQRLRCGFTTGSCAAAASAAASRMLLENKEVFEVAILTPEGVRLSLPVEDIAISDGEKGRIVRCAVRKDAGDDVDVTNGLLIYSTASFIEKKDVIIEAGEGIGRVTKPGLDQPVGEAAINSTPQRMIREEVRRALLSHRESRGIHILIEAPGGEELAEKTLNGKLGIVGGISILGTTGIVHPMSKRALLDSIHVEIRSALASGDGDLIVAPGNYGERFAKGLGISTDDLILCSNFIGETVDLAVVEGAKSLLLIGHVGKLIKLAGGIMNTHSREADARSELMCASVIRCGGSRELARSVLDCVTTESALALVKEEEEDLLARVTKDIATRADAALQHRCKGALKTGVILFSSELGLLARAGIREPRKPE